MARELGTTVTNSNGWSLNDIAINTLYKLASAPEEVKEELGKTEFQFGFDTLTIDTLYKLASAPEEVKEEY